ncbi:murein transglycosylase [Photobacterium sp. CCB-ST2H9]|uniref:murein transglycosylase n=1 Tax=Photobacterium sp. CCB-ST2H9 TaxID=2912855 RepID=UPI0020045199|nr:murein transglycosylase [Photobacterium sp. CCB-ST2H9]UTM56722.1 murein transglycosylase [Photobacterium sp. CCB-ST2H9]
MQSEAVVHRRGRWILGLGLWVLLGGGVAQAASLEQQRTWYEAAKAALESDDQATYKSYRSKLNDYPLTPYLDYRQFQDGLARRKPAEVRAFIDKYQDFPFTIKLGYAYLDELVDAKRWQDMVDFQKEPPYRESYQCKYYYALSKTGHTEDAWAGAKSLWLTGQSLDDDCDPLLAAWQKAGKRTSQLILDRMLLVFDAGNYGLLKFLDKQLTGKADKKGKTMLSLYKNPEGVADFAKRSKVNDFNRQLSTLAYQRLVFSDVGAALKQFGQVAEGQKLSAEQKQALADFTASRLMDSENQEQIRWRDQVLRDSSDDGLIERRIRVALRQAHWNEAQDWISELSDEEQRTLRWQFWQAHLLAKSDPAAAKPKYQALLGERNFYSAAAATVLGEKIDFPVDTLTEAERDVTPYLPALKRIEEMLAQDKVYDANLEWWYLLKDLDPKAIWPLAGYADQNQWHHLTVQATIYGQMWEHLSLRFPLAFKDQFQSFGKKRELSMTTMMALARQESALNPQAMSPVGARGLMQLMPATAKHTARKLGYRYKGSNSLLDPEVNIRLGSGYLKMMLARYDNNRIFAFAAYNAGPGRVTRWRELSDGQLDAFTFMETIPFGETRGYVQNVLMFEVYYDKLTGNPTELLTSKELNTQY